MNINFNISTEGSFWNNQWHTITRDLQADLNRALPGVTLTSVRSISFRGDAKIDNIKLK